MSSSSSTNLQYTLFGESHGAAIGITIQGLPHGFSFDFEKINEKLGIRSGKTDFNTPRQEKNNYQILSGYFNEQTTGSPFTVIFPNDDTKSKDYLQFTDLPRPGHADYVAQIKYDNHHDYRGGGHFSGRLTTPIVFLGAMLSQIITDDFPTFSIASHIQQLKGSIDDSYYKLRENLIKEAFNLQDDHTIDARFFSDTMENDELFDAYLEKLKNLQECFQQLDKAFPVINRAAKEKMLKEIETAKTSGTTVGGNIETVVFNTPVALGEPFFHSVESTISSLLFSIGSVKSVHFGYGDHFIEASGNQVKDEIIEIDNGKIYTLYNYNGGINGGITNGEDIVISTTFKPISSIQQEQHTLNIKTKRLEALKVSGRHDVTIANRIIPVIEAMILIGLYDLMLSRKMNA